MSMEVCLFEDNGWRDLLPLTWLHSPWELLAGTRTFLARARSIFPERRVSYHCRQWLSDALHERHDLKPNSPDGALVLYVNARTIDFGDVAHHDGVLDGEFALWNGDELVAFRWRANSALPEPHEFVPWVEALGLPRIAVKARTFRRWWDLIYLQEELLEKDAELFRTADQNGPRTEGAHILGAARLVGASDSLVEPGAVVDARGGPVILDKGASIGMGAVVVGPVYLGPRSLVKPLSHIGPQVSLGPYSRVGGEVARTIFLGYGNKQHHGFLGHAYIGNWVNLGAGTTNSNLKNTYGDVRVWVNGRFESSGKTFVGCAVGDHSKTAINTVFNTGTVIGVSSNIFGSGFPPKFIPSFCWGGVHDTVAYDLDRAMETAEKVMRRRDVPLTPVERRLLEEVWRITETERNPSG